jgi:hypothetical protein
MFTNLVGECMAVYVGIKAREPEGGWREGWRDSCVSVEVKVMF